MTDAHTEAEKVQWEWLNNHPIQDKDQESKTADSAQKSEIRNRRGKRMRRSPSAWEFPLPEEEIDLHGYVSGEAVAAVENLMDGMEKAGLHILRIIHGGGNPGYGNVKHIIDRSCRTLWKNRIVFYRTEPDNAGSSILKLGNAPQAAVIPRKKKK
jgi:DNA-nicking Smr family endonuclease